MLFVRPEHLGFLVAFAVGSCLARHTYGSDATVHGGGVPPV